MRASRWPSSRRNRSSAIWSTLSRSLNLAMTPIWCWPKRNLVQPYWARSSIFSDASSPTASMTTSNTRKSSRKNRANKRKTEKGRQVLSSQKQQPRRVSKGHRMSRNKKVNKMRSVLRNRLLLSKPKVLPLSQMSGVNFPSHLLSHSS